MDYRIQLSKKSEQWLAEADPGISARILAAIGKLAEQPYPPGCTKLSGSEKDYRIRIGDYRVTYRVEHSVLTIFVIKVGHRRDIYKKS